MNLTNPITAELIQQRRQQVLARFTAAVHSSKMRADQLQALHAEVSKRQAELLQLTTATQREISKYFQAFQPLACNPATFADLRLYGGPRIALNHGKLYIGTIVDGKRHGKGVIISQKGKIYEGELLLNERNGVGVEIYENANFYIGGFAGSKREGEGRMVWANRSSQGTTFQYYVGSWKGGEPNGHGLHSTEAWNFVGNFKQGVRNGKGIEVRAGIVFEGSFVNNLREGKGVLIEEGVQFYEGEFRGGRKHGYGRRKCLNSGEEYEGFFQDNRKEGIGASLKDGLLYRGLFTEDKPNGTGEFVKSATLLTKEKDCRSVTEQEVKRSSKPRPRGEIQSAQFVRSNPAPPLQSQHSTKSLQKIVRPPKMAKLNTSNTSRDKERDKHSESEKEGIKLKSRASMASAKVIRVNDNPERHACSYKHCSCHKWEENEAEKLKVDEKRILRLFSARKSLLKSIV